MGAPDLNDIAYWLPPLRDAGLPVPETLLVHTTLPLMDILDGVLDANDFSDFCGSLLAASYHVREGNGPFFLRTGHTSGKHSWRHTCYVADTSALRQHVYNLIEESACAGVLGQPVESWAVRRLIPTAPLFVCKHYAGFPVVREFRVFANDGAVLHMQPYWPPQACAMGGPSTPDWEALLARAAVLDDEDAGLLRMLGAAAAIAVGGYWSVDCLQDSSGGWWVTDMAEGGRSYCYDPASGAPFEAATLLA